MLFLYNKSMMTTLYISKKMFNKVKQSCLEQAPRESCGFVYGSKSENGFHVSWIRLVPNVAANPTAHFEMDPRSVIQALMEETAPEKTGFLRNTELIGIFHSHPETPPIPSIEDKTTFWHTLPTYWILSLLPGLVNPLHIYEMPFPCTPYSGNLEERLCRIRWC